MFCVGSFWNHKGPPKENKKYANAMEVRQVIYCNCVDFSDLGFFFKTAWDILCHSIFIKSTPLSKRKAVKERNPTIIIHY